MEAIAAVGALSALAHESRLEAFRLLVQAGPEGLTPGRIGEQLGLPATTLSFHLNQLKQAGLVRFRREGRCLIYAAEYDAIDGLLGYLTENCCRGDALACGLPEATACAPGRQAEPAGAA